MLTVQITKRKDGGSVLRCVRKDGSVTWQKQDRHAAFFAIHDLTHFAVESVLGFRNGFFGLIAQGWDIDDATGKGARGRLPEEAGQVEQLVGLMGAERASGEIMTAEDLTRFATLPSPLTEEQARRVRERCGELFWRWNAFPPGQTLELLLES
jgi:hypothetical protein